MVFGLKKKKKEKVSLLIDVGSGSIGGAFVLTRPDALPKILYNTRLPLTVFEKSEPSQLLDETSRLLDELLDGMMKHGFSDDGKNKIKNISDALVTFSSPWFMSKTKQIHIEQDKPFIITKAFLEDIIKKEEENFIAELSADKTESLENSLQIIEKSIIHTKINGYTFSDSIGKSTKIFDAFLFLSVVPRTVSDAVASALLKHAHLSKEKTTLHSFPLVSFSVLRDLYHSVSNFVLFDVAGEMSDVSLVQDNIIIKTASIPLGRNFIIRRIAKAFGVSPEIAESTLRIYNADKAEDSVSTRMEEALADTEHEWSAYFEEAFALLSEKTVLPAKVYMTADGDVAEVFSDFLKVSKTDLTAAFRKNADITSVDSTVLTGLYESDIKNPEDEFITLLTIFFAKQSAYVTI